VPALLFAAVVCYIVGPLAAPSGLRDLHEHDAMSQKYALVAADATAYRWANAAVAVGIALGVAAIFRLIHTTRAHTADSHRPVTGLLVAAAGWVTLAILRISLVTGAASDVARGDAEGGTVADAALRGDGPFLATSPVAGAALLWLAVAWRRAAFISWPTAGLLALAGITTALFVRSDPLAIVFISPFPFVLAFLPLGIVTIHRARKPIDAEAQLTTAG
jgi:hypothetical protein